MAADARQASIKTSQEGDTAPPFSGTDGKASFQRRQHPFLPAAQPYKTFLKQGAISHGEPLHEASFRSGLVILTRPFMPDLCRFPGSSGKDFHSSTAYAYF
ncbi:hypothetical protein [Akkermansia sp.]|uniref:hypothetical protein n=1 Tax=Akkermansia sp. TaxID=1872421 RepID=UPI0025C729E9|nr:hypothetical protein [Akkermansia sp.]